MLVDRFRFSDILVVASLVDGFTIMNPFMTEARASTVSWSDRGQLWQPCVLMLRARSLTSGNQLFRLANRCPCETRDSCRFSQQPRLDDSHPSCRLQPLGHGEFLVNRGASSNLISTDGGTALSVATKFGSQKNVQYLLPLVQCPERKTQKEYLEKIEGRLSDIPSSWFIDPFEVEVQEEKTLGMYVNVSHARGRRRRVVSSEFDV